jgi:hypothetical protein
VERSARRQTVDPHPVSEVIEWDVIQAQKNLRAVLSDTAKPYSWLP